MLRPRLKDRRGVFTCDSSNSSIVLLFVVIRVRLFNVGLHFLAAKVAFSCPSVDIFGNFFGGLMTLVQVKSVPNFC